MSNVIEELMKEIEDKRKVIVNKSRIVNDMKNGIDKLNRGKTEHSKRLQVVRKEIDDIQHAALSASKGKERELLQNISDITNQIKSADTTQEELRNQKSILINEAQKCQQTVNSDLQQIADLNEDIHTLGE